MAAPTVPHAGEQSSKICEISASVVTGFEHVATQDVKNVLAVEVRPGRGKITMFVPFEKLPRLMDLNCVDNMHVIMNHHKKFQLADTEDGVMQQIEELVPTVDWAHGLDVWRQFFSFEHPIVATPQPGWYLGISAINRKKRQAATKSKDKRAEATSSGTEDRAATRSEDNKADKESTSTNPTDTPPDVNHQRAPQPEPGETTSKDNTDDEPPQKIVKKKSSIPLNPLMPGFRATCYRTGLKHCFKSPEAQIYFGGAIQDYFGWNVNLKNYDIEAILEIVDDHLTFGIALTHESRHKRHIAHFGPTTLRPTIAYNMLVMCRIQPHEIVCDPMCGGGSIPIEAALNWPQSYHICGDSYDAAPTRAANNIQALNEKRQSKERVPINVDVFRWDCCKLPLKDNSVDVFVSDMPFGKRSGNRVSNWHLYPMALEEMARVCRVEGGRACLLTHDRKCMTKTLMGMKALWNWKTTIGVNIGGLAAGVYLLYRANQNSVPTAVATANTAAVAASTSQPEKQTKQDV